MRFCRTEKGTVVPQKDASESSKIEKVKPVPYKLDDPLVNDLHVQITMTTQFSFSHVHKQTWVPHDATRNEIKELWNGTTLKIRTSDGGWLADTGDDMLTDRSPGAVNPGSGKEPIELIAQVPPIKIKARTTSCDGGSGPMGHPRVFINVDKGVASCGYCGLRFVQDEEAHQTH